MCPPHFGISRAGGTFALGRSRADSVAWVTILVSRTALRPRGRYARANAHSRRWIPADARFGGHRREKRGPGAARAVAEGDRQAVLEGDLQIRQAPLEQAARRGGGDHAGLLPACHRQEHLHWLRRQAGALSHLRAGVRGPLRGRPGALQSGEEARRRRLFPATSTSKSAEEELGGEELGVLDPERCSRPSGSRACSSRRCRRCGCCARARRRSSTFGPSRCFTWAMNRSALPTRSSRPSWGSRCAT